MPTQAELAKQELAEQQSATTEAQRKLAQQAALYQNPNLLRKAGLGYLLSPYYKQQRLEAIQQVGIAQQQAAERQQKLQQFEQQIKSYETQQTQASGPDYNYLSKLASKFGSYSPDFLRKQLGLSRNEASLVKEIYEGNLSRQKYVEQQSAYAKEGLQPIVQGGKIVGFYDSSGGRSIPIENIPKLITQEPLQAPRFERAGVITIEQQPASIPTFQTLSTPYTPISTPQYTPAYQTPSTPVNFGAAQVYSQVREVTPPVTLSEKLAFRAAEIRATSNKDYPFRSFDVFGAQVLRTGAGLLNTVGGIKKVFTEPEYFIKTPFRNIKTIKDVSEEAIQRLTSGEGYPEAARLIREEPETVLATIVTEAALVGATSKVAQKLLEPVRIVEKVPPTRYTSSAGAIDTLQGGKLTTQADFSITARTPQRYALEVGKLDFYLDRRTAALGPKAFSSRFSIQELQQMFPRGKVVIMQGPRVGLLQTEPFLISEGKIYASAVDERRLPFGMRASGTLNRVSKPTVFSFEGEQVGEGIKLSSARFGRYDDTTKALIKDLQKVRPSSEATVGFLDTRDVGVLSEGKLKITPKGRRITRTQVLATSEEVMSIKSETGIIKEATVYDDIITGVDVSYPRFRAPRKITRIQGRTQRILVELPVEPEPIIIYKGRKGTRPPQSISLQEQIALNQQALQRAIGGAAVKLPRPRLPSIKAIRAQETIRVSALPLIVGGGGKLVSQFAGSGVYERTELIVTANLFSKERGELRFGVVPIAKSEKQLNIFLSRDVSASIAPELTRELSRELNREVNREAFREIPRELPREITRETQRELQRQIQREAQREVQREAQRQTTRVPTPIIQGAAYPGAPIVKKGKLSSSASRAAKAYTLLLRRRGRFVRVARGLPQGRAFKLGSEAVQTELARQFRIVEGGETFERDIVFTPSEKVFRAYRVRRGKRIALPFGQYIQRQSALLKTPEEKIAIRQARQLKRLGFTY